MRDLIVFGEDFGGLPSSTQHLITHLNKERTILWVNSIGLRKPRLTAKDARRALSKLLPTSHAEQGQLAVPSHIKVVNLKTIPAPKGSAERMIAKWVMKHQLQKLIKHFGLVRPILWSSLPTTADLCGELNESARVYYCGDDFSALAGVDHDTVANHEQKLVHRANLVLTASEVLRNKFSAEKTKLLKHGVSYDLFNQPAPRAIDLPLGQKVLGFYGSLSEWLDYDLINRVAEAMPDWNFVFIGKNELTRNPFKPLDNIHLLGPKPHHELPGYVQHWRASWLPFKNNQQIRACNPLKLLEYIAAGQPIITSSFPAAQTYSAEVNTYHFAHQVIEWLHNPASLIAPNTEVARMQSWQSKARALDTILEAL